MNVILSSFIIPNSALYAGTVVGSFLIFIFAYRRSNKLSADNKKLDGKTTISAVAEQKSQQLLNMEKFVFDLSYDLTRRLDAEELSVVKQKATFLKSQIKKLEQPGMLDEKQAHHREKISNDLTKVFETIYIEEQSLRGVENFRPGISPAGS